MVRVAQVRALTWVTEGLSSSSSEFTATDSLNFNERMQRMEAEVQESRQAQDYSNASFFARQDGLERKLDAIFTLLDSSLSRHDIDSGKASRKPSPPMLSMCAIQQMNDRQRAEARVRVYQRTVDRKKFTYDEPSKKQCRNVAADLSKDGMDVADDGSGLLFLQPVIPGVSSMYNLGPTVRSTTKRCIPLRTSSNPQRLDW